MSYSEVFVSRLKEADILTTEPIWIGGSDQLDFDHELHQEVTPARFVQLKDLASVWQSTFSWQGSSSGNYGTVFKSVVLDCWRARHGASFPFWMPSWKNDLTLLQDIGASSTTIRVSNLAFFDFYNRAANRPGRRWYLPELSDSRLRFTLFALLLIHRDTDGSEVRRYLPIGDPAIADDELSSPQGSGAVSLAGGGVDIKLRLYGGEALPAISTSDVLLLSLVRHVRFAGNMSISFAADYVPRITTTVSQVFDEAIFSA